MSVEKATAIVLRTVEFSETSLVVTLYTREFGKVGALAKGARRLKGPFESALDLLALCRIVFLRKSSESLDLVTEAKLLRRFRVARGGLGGLYGGYYVAELLGSLTDDYEAQPELFDLADRTLAALAAGETAAQQVLRFELGMLRILGLMPSLDRCADCGGDLPAKGPIAFGHLDGGALCATCRVGKQQVAAIDAGALRVLNQLAAPEEQPSRRLAIDARTRGRLRGLMNQYMAHLLGRKPRLQPYLSKEP